MPGKETGTTITVKRCLRTTRLKRTAILLLFLNTLSFISLGIVYLTNKDPIEKMLAKDYVLQSNSIVSVAFLIIASALFPGIKYSGNTPTATNNYAEVPETAENETLAVQNNNRKDRFFDKYIEHGGVLGFYFTSLLLISSPWAANTDYNLNRNTGINLCMVLSLSSTVIGLMYAKYMEDMDESEAHNPFAGQQLPYQA